jgi:hypothetical protein
MVDREAGRGKRETSSSRGAMATGRAEYVPEVLHAAAS